MLHGEVNALSNINKFLVSPLLSHISAYWVLFSSTLLRMSANSGMAGLTMLILLLCGTSVKLVSHMSEPVACD